MTTPPATDVGVSTSKDTQQSADTQDPVQEIADGTVSLMGSVQAAQKAMAHTVAEAQKKLAEVDRKIEAAEVVLTDPKSVKRYKDLQARAQQLRQTIDSYTAAMERLAQPQAQPTGDTGTQEDATPEDVRSVPLYTEEDPKQGRPRDVAIGEQDTQGTAPSDSGRGTEGDGGTRGTDAKHPLSQEDTQSGQEVSPTLINPLSMPEQERQRRGNMLRNAPAIDIATRQIVSTPELSARKAAEKWWENNVPEPVFYDTEAGQVEINKKSVETSLAHRYGQAKLDAITSLVEGFKHAVYLGTLPDGRERGVVDHYFAYPINYNGKRCYVFCRAMQDANKNRLYVHEVFVADNIKMGDTLQTAASKPHGGIALYKDILSNVLEITPEQSSLLGGPNSRQYPTAQESSSDKDTKNPETIQQITDAVEKLGLGVEIITSPSQLPKEEKKAREAIEKGAEVKGWYNAKTGKAYLYLPNAEDAADAVETVLHEVVAHKGLRGLLGKEGFDRLCDEVWDMMDAGQRRRFMAYVTRKRKMTETEFLAAVADGNKRREAADEYIAHLTESLDTEKLANESAWKKVLEAVRAFLGRMGIGRDANISDESITRLLQDSYRQLRRQKEGGNTENIIKENISKAESEVNVTPTEAQDSSVNKQKQEEKDNSALFRIGNEVATAEERRIEEEAKANGTYMKAPNGKPTNLTQKQWLQVRTKAFKDWFGDWEKANLYERATIAWNDSNSKGKVVVGLSEKAKRRFNQLLGTDTKQFVITDDAIRHIKNKHSEKEELRGQKNLTPEDIVVIPYLVNNYDSMELNPQKNDNKGNRAIEIRKRINGFLLLQQ